MRHGRGLLDSRGNRRGLCGHVVGSDLQCTVRGCSRSAAALEAQRDHRNLARYEALTTGLKPGTELKLHSTRLERAPHMFETFEVKERPFRRSYAHFDTLAGLAPGVHGVGGTGSGDHKDILSPTQAAHELRSYLENTGNFGLGGAPSETVRKYQRFLGVTPDGIVGPLTRASALQCGVGLPPCPGNARSPRPQEYVLGFGSSEAVAPGQIATFTARAQLPFCGEQLLVPGPIAKSS